MVLIFDGRKIGLYKMPENSLVVADALVKNNPQTFSFTSSQSTFGTPSTKKML